MPDKIITSDNSKTTVLIRLMVGTVFLSGGIQKFLFPDALGAGRFAKNWLPSPEFLGGFVGAFEIVCGLLLLLGLFTRIASIPPIVIMIAAIATNRADVLAKEGFWEMLHGRRTDWAMLLGSIFLFIKGAGSFSLDKSFQSK